MDNEMKEASLRSLLMESLKPDQSSDAASPEDIAWADSCLIKDWDASDSEWDSLKGALLEVLNFQPELDVSPTTDTGAKLEATEGEILQSNGSAGETEYSSGTTEDDHTMEVDLGRSSTSAIEDANLSSEELEGETHPMNRLLNALRPDFRDDLQAIGNADPDIDLGFPVSDLEASADDIFRVWDLGTSDEEDEFMKQLNKALAECSSATARPDPGDSQEWKDMVTVTVDDIVAGISDLSLKV